MSQHRKSTRHELEDRNRRQQYVIERQDRVIEGLRGRIFELEMQLQRIALDNADKARIGEVVS